MCAAAYPDDTSDGCEHYKRKCKLVAPCCKREYTCRFCHDEAEKHKLIRTSIQQVVCVMCHKKQTPQKRCQNTTCNILFAKYFCSICRLYTDDSESPFHCDGCGICRLGGEDNFFHCSICDMCYNRILRDNHQCVENASHKSCPICLQDLHTTRESLEVPSCGHLIHKKCYESIRCGNGVTCPTCRHEKEIS